MTIDPITLEVINHRLNEISRTMEHLLFHSGYSPILRESFDGSSCILDRDGYVITGAGMPIHLFPYHRTVTEVIRLHGRDMQPGDSFLANDPFSSGVFHVPDAAIITPVFYRNELIAFCGSIAHKPDVGGMVPGSSGAAAREVFHEGVLYPAVRYWTEDGVNEDIERIFRRNSRTPAEVVGDARAQVGCTRIGADKLRELCDEYGPKMIAHSFREFVSRSEARLRKQLARWPDGDSEAEAFTDNDGADLDKPVRVRVKITKEGDSLELDFSGSDPQARGPVNIRPQSVETGSVLALLGLTDPRIPINDGVRRALTFVNPEGKVTHARFPAPVNNYFSTTHLVYSCVQRALAHFSTERVSAPAGFGTGATAIGYLRSLSGKPAVQYELQVMSLGGTNHNDGAFGAMPMTHITPNTPLEVLETEYPVRLTRWEPKCDSAGAGKRRGGLGCVREYELLEEADFTLRLGQFKFGAWGVEGGKAPNNASCTIIYSNGGQERLPPLASRKLQAGDRIRIESAGGGGFGSPYERDADLVLKDVRNGYVSVEMARKDYGVSIDTETMTVLAEETRSLRFGSLV